LCALLAKESSPLPVLAVCKETETEAGDDTLGIAEFEDKYFCGPMYHDPQRTFYEYLGNKKISLPLGKMIFNPLGTWRDIKSMGARLKERGLDGNMKGDGLVKGGVLVIAPDDRVVHTFFEDIGNGIPEAEAAKIAEAVRQVASAAQARS